MHDHSRFDYIQFPIDYDTTPSSHGIATYNGYEYAIFGGRFPGVVQQNIGYWYFKKTTEVIACSDSSKDCGLDYPLSVGVQSQYYTKCCADTDPLNGYWFRQNSCPFTLSFISIECPGEKTHEEATEFCAGYGGRLCTQDELGNDCAKNVGCSYDDEPTWTTNYHYQYSADTGCLSSQNNAFVSQSAMEACDASVSLLAGSETSIGFVTKLANLIRDEGVERMSGRCCLDTPTSSYLFGEEVSSIDFCVYNICLHFLIYTTCCLDCSVRPRLQL